MAGGFTLPKYEISLRVRFLASAFQYPLASYLRDSLKDVSLHRVLPVPNRINKTDYLWLPEGRGFNPAAPMQRVGRAFRP